MPVHFSGLAFDFEVALFGCAAASSIACCCDYSNLELGRQS